MKKVLITIIGTIWANYIFAQGISVDTTIMNNNTTFNIRTESIKNDRILLIINRISQFIMKDTLESDGLSDIKFTDFNKDGSSDIMINYMGNVDTYQLYLYDSINRNFRNLKGFDKYPQAVQLKTNSKYYYSYHRAGCADNYWASDLFLINDFKTIQIGHIDGQGCDSEKKQILIYKIKNNSEEDRILVNKLPYKKNIQKFEDKWVFIKKYWNESYKRFE